MLAYKQSTGALLRDGVEIGLGWAGRDLPLPLFRLRGGPATGYALQRHLNDPASQGLYAVGPLPRGNYIVGELHDSVGLGPAVRSLTPVPNDGETPNRDGSLPHMLGRSGFFIHDYNPAHASSSSDGCIIMPRAVREALTTGEILTVVV